MGSLKADRAAVLSGRGRVAVCPFLTALAAHGLADLMYSARLWTARFDERQRYVAGLGSRLADNIGGELKIFWRTLPTGRSLLQRMP